MTCKITSLKKSHLSSQSWQKRKCQMLEPVWELTEIKFLDKFLMETKIHKLNLIDR